MQGTLVVAAQNENILYVCTCTRVYTYMCIMCVYMYMFNACVYVYVRVMYLCVFMSTCICKIQLYTQTDEIDEWLPRKMMKLYVDVCVYVYVLMCMYMQMWYMCVCMFVCICKCKCMHR